MPYSVKVLAACCRAGSADPEAAARAQRFVDEIASEDFSGNEVRLTLESLQTDAPGVFVAAITEGEEKDRSLLVLSDGVVRERSLQRTKRTWSVPDEPALDELVKELLRPERPAKNIPVTSAKARAASKGALAEARQRAEDAIAARDIEAMFGCLAAAELQGTAAAAVREKLWKRLRERPLGPRWHDRVLAGLRDESDLIARDIRHRLFIEDALPPRLIEELDAAWAARPLTRHVVERLGTVIRDWGDFPFPAGYLAAAPPELRALLTEDEPARPPRRRGGAQAAVDRLVADLERGSIAALRDVRAACGDDETADGAALRRFAAAGAPVHRAAAIEALELLREPDAVLAPLTEGLPATAGIRALRHRAGYRTSPIGVLPIAHDAPLLPVGVATPDIEAIPYGSGTLAVSRMSVASMRSGDKVRWRFDAHGAALQPLAVLAPLDPSLDVAFVSSRHGLHCLDAATGVERWCNRTVGEPGGTRSLRDHVPLISVARDVIGFLAAAGYCELERGTGILRRVIELPGRATRGLQPHADGVLVVDGPAVLDGRLDLDYVPSGVVIRRDGVVQDAPFPRPLAGVWRAAGDLRAEFSAVDVVIDSGGRSRHWALPLAPEQCVATIGPIVEHDGRPIVYLGISIPFVFGVKRYIAVELPRP